VRFRCCINCCVPPALRIVPAGLLLSAHALADVVWVALSSKEPAYLEAANALRAALPDDQVRVGEWSEFNFKSTPPQLLVRWAAKRSGSCIRQPRRRASSPCWFRAAPWMICAKPRQGASRACITNNLCASGQPLARGLSGKVPRRRRAWPDIGALS